MNDRIEYWIDLARYDLISAKTMLSGERYIYVGFLCHQTVEKILKACYEKYINDTPPYIHNLLRLSELTGLIHIYNAKQRQTVVTLNPLYIETRYPINRDALKLLLTHEYCTRLLDDTEDLLKWIGNKLSE